MNKMVKTTICTFAILTAASSTVFANDIDVKIIGTISPSACTPILSGDGTIDYGIIPASSLKKDDYTQLDKKRLNFSITCDAPTKVALRAINGRPDSAAGTTELGIYGGEAPDGIDNVYGTYVYGLGLDSGQKVGGYNISLHDITLDGENAGYITQEEGKPWEAGTATFLAWDKPFLRSFTLGDTTEPAAFMALAGTLGVQAYLNKSSELDLTKPVKLDGLTTLELVYL